MTRAEAADELREAGWPGVAEDIEMGEPLAGIRRTLIAIGEGDTDAATIVAGVYAD